MTTGSVLASLAAVGVAAADVRPGNFDLLRRRVILAE